MTTAPRRSPATSLALFTALAVAGFAGSAGTDRWLATRAGSGVGLLVGLVILARQPHRSQCPRGLLNASQ